MLLNLYKEALKIRNEDPEIRKPEIWNPEMQKYQKRTLHMDWDPSGWIFLPYITSKINTIKHFKMIPFPVHL